VLNIPLMTDFVKVICRAICEPVCSSRPDLVAFLINYHGVLINLTHV
jgi:hypothetical protein